MRYRHKKRGGEYEVIGTAQVQAPDDAPLTDYEIVTVYRSKTGELWVRRDLSYDLMSALWFWDLGDYSGLVSH